MRSAWSKRSPGYSKVFAQTKRLRERRRVITLNYSELKNATPHSPTFLSCNLTIDFETLNYSNTRVP